ncbi:AraC family transcriptional regulator [Aeromicrobium panaciterrae]|uniref:helix-turn-helix transcriptional regulator n=1 Tax=Aeromicrobium panaciterrae TaxID=363861 RepID=UPI0031D76066
MSTGERVRAWRPDVPGVDEVLHAHFTEHAYPAHTHDHWTLLLVDTGGVEYDLAHHHHQAAPGSLTVLPPHVPHDGRAAIAGGFDKRVVYVDDRWLSSELVGAAVRQPSLRDDSLTRAMARLHDALTSPGDELEAESRLAFLSERITQHLDHSAEPLSTRRESRLARLIRDRLDCAPESTPTLASIAADLGVHASHAVRVFSREYGMPPHRYVTGRRIDRARHLLLDGTPVAGVAAAVGFYDQAHLTRHFRRVLGVTPGAYVRHAA